ncbi:ECF RNA polymerase sigma factor SigW [compost metagenome]
MFKKKTHTTFNETQQIELAKKDHRYFGPLYERYFEQIFRFVFKRLGGNEEVAGDLAQQCFIKAMANIQKYEDRGLPFSAWLYRIAQNEVNMFFRSQKKNYSVEISDRQLYAILEENGENSIQQEDLDQLIEIINNLDETQADLIELRFFQQLSFKEIADIYQISEANAKMKIYRLLEKINTNWKRES